MLLMKNKMNKEKKQMSNDLLKNEDILKKRFLLHLNKISSDVLFVLSLSAFLNDTERHSKHLAVTDVIQKLATELKRYDGRLDNISHKRYRELFESINRNGDVLQICKDTYTSQISEEGKDFSLAVKTFFQWVNDRKYENDTEDEMRRIRMKRKSEENEWCKAEIASLTKKKATKYGEKLREYEEEKKCFEEHLEKVYHESDLNRIRTEAKNKNDLSIYSENIQDSLNELEEKMKEKLESIVVLHENNIIETENMKKNVLKKGTLLDVLNNRYSHDMLMRYKKKESLQQTIKSKTNVFETLKVNVMSIEMNLKELEEDEKMYFKREFFDKLDVIKEKIALRAISKFLIPYVNLKFKSRRLKMLKKKKTKNQKKL